MKKERIADWPRNILREMKSLETRSALDKLLSMDYINFRNKNESGEMYVKRGGCGEIRQLNSYEERLLRFAG